MREKLKKIEEERGLFRGLFKKYGAKTGYRGQSAETVLLVQVRDGSGALVSDHLWFNLTKGFEKLGTLREGEIIQFEARVRRYKKGYVNRRAGIDESSYDYKLSHPTKIARVRS